MGKPAARLGDLHTCPMVTPGVPPVPHVGGPISGPSVPTVLIGGKPAAVVGDTCVCVGPPDSIAMGSTGVFIGGKPAARMGDSTAHGGVVAVGFPTVLIGDAGPAVSPGVQGLREIAAAVNPSGSVVNCGNIIDAVVARLTGSNPTAIALNAMDGSFADIENRFNTRLQWGHTFQDAFNAVAAQPDGTSAIVGINYGTGLSHVVVMTKRNGRVAIVEGQDWGPGNPREAISTPARANQRYNAGGTTTVGYGLIP